MALIFMDGCDDYSADNDILTKWDFVNPGEITIGTSDGRFGGGCIKGVGANSAMGFGKMFLDRVTGTTVTTDEFYLGFSFYYADTAGSDPHYIANFMSSNGIFNFRLETDNSDESLTVTRSDEYTYNGGRTELGSSSASVLSTGTWHWIELRAVVSGTVGIIEVKVDGTQVINLTSQNNKEALANADIAGVFFGTNREALNLNRYDDIVIWDSTGSEPTGFIGDSRIDTLRPNGAGDSSDSTPLSGNRHDNVDDAGLNDGDTTYVDQSTAADLDLYDIDAFGRDPATVHAVAVNHSVKATSTEPREWKAMVKSGTTEGSGATVWAGNSDYHSHQEFFLTNPDTAAAWTGAEIDDMQIGQEVVS